MTEQTKPGPANRAFPCANCRETKEECACMRNKCIKCGEPVGYVLFFFCNTCWETFLREG